jgi:hypothetical protein
MIKSKWFNTRLQWCIMTFTHIKCCWCVRLHFGKQNKEKLILKQYDVEWSSTRYRNRFIQSACNHWGFHCLSCYILVKFGRCVVIVFTVLGTKRKNERILQLTAYLRLVDLECQLCFVMICVSIFYPLIINE